MSGRRLPDTVAPLASFVRKAQVLQQYRTFLKTIRRIQSPDVARELRVQVRSEFKQHVDVEGAAEIRELLQRGSSQLKEVEKIVAYTTPASDGSTWVGQRGMSDTDELGRIGQGWPWQQGQK
mmetsp:Transcript_2412/g.7135  ORF Transcript_2412/g.7135 Transcript_2412/m.7135 type:complete len:122 (-) Transcript_2412:16-381(-)